MKRYTLVILLLPFLGSVSSFSPIATQDTRCTQSRSTRVSTTTIASYSNVESYRCCLFNLCRCYRRRYSTRTEMIYRTQLVKESVCCPGYYESERVCLPICTDCPESHLCLASHMCACPFEGPGTNCTEPPQNVTLTAIASDQLAISWDQLPQNVSGELVANFYIVLFQGKTYRIEQSIDNSSNQLAMEFGSLTPYTTYNCCVAARTPFGTSRLSCVTEKTLESTPADPPENVSVTTFSSVTVHVQWSPPLTPNGIIVLYTIYINDVPDVNVTAIPGTQSYSVGGFAANQMVRVSISASTEIGEGPITVQHTVTTHESAPSAVQNLEVFARDNNTLHVSWNPPLSPNGVLTGYQVLVTNLITLTETLYTAPPNQHESTLSSGIYPFIRYEVTVTASTSAGAGDPLKVRVYSWEGEPHNSPPNITSSRSSATTASVEWAEMSWEDLRGWLVSYEVGYESVRSGQQCLATDSTYNETVSVDREVYGVTGLDPGLQYCVWVAGRTSAGVGPFSHSLIPWYVNRGFTVVLEKSNCSEWIGDTEDIIIEDLRREVSRGIEQFCQCKLLSAYIAKGSLTCYQDKLFYDGIIISTDKRDSSYLLMDLNKWLSSDPIVIAKGEQLKVVNPTINDGVKTTISNKSATERNDAEKDTPPRGISIVGPVVGAVVAVAGVAAMAVGVIVTVVCHRQRSKSSLNVTTVPNPTATFTPDTTLPAKTQEYEQLKMDEKQTEYECPTAENENVYEDLEDVMETVLAGKDVHNLTYVDMSPEVVGSEESEDEDYSKVKNEENEKC